MFEDPIVEEVRQIRREIAEECGDDPRAFLKMLREVESRYRDRLVRGQPVPIEKAQVKG